MCVRDIEFTYLYDFSIECWNCSGEWNHLFFFTYEIRNVPFNIQFYITIILLDYPVRLFFFSQVWQNYLFVRKFKSEIYKKKCSVL
jgi:hypothetical protein